MITSNGKYGFGAIASDGAYVFAHITSGGKWASYIDFAYSAAVKVGARITGTRACSRVRSARAYIGVKTIIPRAYVALTTKLNAHALTVRHNAKAITTKLRTII